MGHPDGDATRRHLDVCFVMSDMPLRAHMEPSLGLAHCAHAL